MHDVRHRERSCYTFFRLAEDAGKESILAELCKAALSEGHSNCFWTFFRSNSRTLAKCIGMKGNKIDSVQSTFRLCSLAHEYGWWKHLSIYFAKGVKEVIVIQP